MEFEPMRARVATLPGRLDLRGQNFKPGSNESNLTTIKPMSSSRPLICIEPDGWNCRLDTPDRIGQRANLKIGSKMAELDATFAARSPGQREALKPVSNAPSRKGFEISGNASSGLTPYGSLLSVTSERSSSEKGLLDRKGSKFEKNRHNFHHSSQRAVARQTNCSVERPLSETSLISFQSHLDKDHQFKSLESLDTIHDRASNPKGEKSNPHQFDPNELNWYKMAKDKLYEDADKGRASSKKDAISENIKFARSLSRNSNMNKIPNTDDYDAAFNAIADRQQTRPVSLLQPQDNASKSDEKTKADISKFRLNRFSFDASNFLVPALQVQHLESISPISSASDFSFDGNDKTEKLEKKPAGYLFEIKKLQQHLRSANEKIQTLEDVIAANRDLSASYQTAIDNLTSKIERLNLMIFEKDSNQNSKRSSIKFSTLKPARNKDEKDNLHEIRRHSSCQSIDISTHESLEGPNKVAKKKKLKFSIRKAFSRKKSIIEHKFSVVNMDPLINEEVKMDREVTELRLQSLAQQQQIQQLQDNIIALNNEMLYLKEENESLKINFSNQ